MLIQEDLHIFGDGIEITDSRIVIGKEIIRSDDISNAWFETKTRCKNKYVSYIVIACVLLFLIDVEFKYFIALGGILLFLLVKKVHYISIIILPRAAIEWKTEDKELFKNVKSALKSFGISCMDSSG